MTKNFKISENKKQIIFTELNHSLKYNLETLFSTKLFTANLLKSASQAALSLPPGSPQV